MQLLVPVLLGIGCSGEIDGPTGAPTDMGLPPGTGNVSTPDALGQVPPGTSGPAVGPDVTPPGTAVADPASTVPVSVEDAPPLPVDLNGVPMYARAMRLTHDQWENSVRYLLGLDETGQRQNLAKDVGALHDFSNHEELLFLNASLYGDYQMAAEELVAIVGMDPNAMSAIYPGDDAQGFIDTVGRRAFRRPLTSDERAALQTLYDEGAALTENGGTPHARGAALVLQGLLQSPYFLYRLETAEAGTRLSGYELAAKLSLLFLSTTPDDELLDRAGNGEFDSDEGVLGLATAMLEQEGAAVTMQTFHAELYLFDRFLEIRKDAELVPEYKTELNEELERASTLFFDRIFRQDLGLTDILTSTVGFVGPNMAPLYGMSVDGQDFQEVELGQERPGFFTQLPFLILNAINLTPDSIHRGVALNEKVLCGEIPPPEAMVTLKAVGEGQTNRDRVTATSGAGTCGEPCHAPYINPLGFAFENYDGMGRLRDMDNGNPIDTKAIYPFVEGRLEFDGAPNLMEIMAEGQQAHLCYAKHLTTYALQRDLTEEDRAGLEALAAESREGTSLKGLLLSLVTSPAFTMRSSGGVQ
jgi:hypothetical protein